MYYALSHYAEAKKARLDLENSEYQIDEVRSRALPQINGTGGLNYNPLLQMSALPGELNPTNPGQTMLIAFGQKWNANLGVTLTQNLFDQSVFTGLKAAKSTREFYQLNSQLTEETVIEQVSTAYYQVWVQQQQIANIDSNIRTTEQVRAVINGQFENGLGKKIDVDRLDVKLINLASQRMQLLNALALYENQLKFFIGMPIDEPINIAGRKASEPNVTLADLTDSLNTDYRTEMKLLQKQEELTQYKKQAVMAEYYPTLSLSANYSYQGLSNSFPIFKGMEQGANWFDVSTVGLNLKIPIFNGKATRSRLNQVDVELKKLKQDVALTTQRLNLEYENARTQIKNAILVLNNQQKNIELAQKVLDNTRNNYREGLAPLTDLLDAQNALYDSQNAYSVSQLDLRIAEIKLLKAKGQLNSLIN
ncbi:MAG: TolC family protein [Chitinophagaceae bacterium]|nr:TolC family protein [Chitinophagaceae bacterium]